MAMLRAMVMCFFITLSWASSPCAQVKNPKPEAAAEQVVIEFFEALSKLDSVALSKTVTTDFLLLEDGAVWNTDSLTTQFRWMVGKSFQRINKLQFVRTEILGNTYWLA